MANQQSETLVMLAKLLQVARKIGAGIEDEETKMFIQLEDQIAIRIERLEEIEWMYNDLCH